MLTDSDTLMFFDKKPHALALYQRFLEGVQALVSPLTIRVQKTQIALSNRHIFACVSFLPVRKAKSRPPEYIVVSLGLPDRLDSPRVDAAVEPYPGRWTHHLLIADPAELDGQLMAWVQEAAAFSQSKR